MNIRRLTHEDLPHLRQFWVEHWGADFMVVHDEIYRPEQLDGFVAEENIEWVGLITFIIKDNEMEITSLDSLREGQGIGTKLIQSVVDEAKQQNCKRIFVITTNDNLNALGFYQRRGFELVKINRGAVNESRKIKPSISLIGENNIPLRDEIELEMSLRGAFVATKQSPTS
jgi:N-acetylglutamate synthase-like GNAT family acetyltransferase